MNPYRMTATLKAPLVVSRNRQSNIASSADFIPGSTLRGAVAAHCIRRGMSVTDSHFVSIFGDNPVCFPDLLPTNAADAIAAVLPFTAYTCKRFNGFTELGGHGVRDTLILNLYSRLNNEPADFSCWSCSRCGHEMKPISGYWNNDARSPRMCSAVLRYQRHTGIDRQTGTVAESLFYTTQALADWRCEDGRFEPQLFSGLVYLNDRQYETLAELISGGCLYAGADRTRGYGAIDLELAPLDPEPPMPDLSLWSSRLCAAYQKLFNVQPPDGLYFSVKLCSPTVLVDELLRPLSVLELACNGLILSPCVQVAKSIPVRGWQSAWGLPKPDDTAIDAGSVFLYNYTGGSPETLQAFLERIMITGVGLRTSEGCGRISVCDSLHVEEVL